MANEHAALARLRNIINDLLRRQETQVNKFEVCGLLQSVKFEWKEGYILSKRENDAPNNTR